MPHLVALRVEIATIVLVHRTDNRHLVDDLQIEPAIDESVGLLGIVRQQADPRNAQILEDLDADAVVAAVGLMP